MTKELRAFIDARKDVIKETIEGGVSEQEKALRDLPEEILNIIEQKELYKIQHAISIVAILELLKERTEKEKAPNYS